MDTLTPTPIGKCDSEDCFEGAGSADGPPVQIRDYTSAAPHDDEWRIEAAGSAYRLVNRGSGQRLEHCESLEALPPVVSCCLQSYPSRLGVGSLTVRRASVYTFDLKQGIQLC